MMKAGFPTFLRLFLYALVFSSSLYAGNGLAQTPASWAPLYSSTCATETPTCPLNANGVCPQMTNSTPDPHHKGDSNASGSNTGSTKLNSGDSVVVWTQRPSDAAPHCYSISNHSTQTIFLPWNTNAAANYREFEQFYQASSKGSGPMSLVSVDACCAPNSDTLAWGGSGYNPNMPPNLCQCPVAVTTPNNTTDEIGTRWLGVKGGPDKMHWGASGDIYGPVMVNAPIISGGNIIGYTNAEATFVCSGGVWVQTHNVGSCNAISGACASGYDISTGGGVLLAKPTTPAGFEALCASSSMIQEDMSGTQDSITGGGTNQATDPFKWQCAGTTGLPAKCEAYLPQSGSCGTAAGGTTKWAPATNLCATGTASTVSTSSDGSTFLWTCGAVGSGNGVGQTACTSYNSTPPGECGSDGAPNPGPYPTLSYTPVNLCAAGDVSSNFAANFNGGQGFWSWNCLPFANANRTQLCVAMNSSALAACGTAVNTSTTQPPSSGLCASGDTASTPYFNGQYWYWTCTQALNGYSVKCTANNPNAPSCGSANGGSFSSLTNISSGLCSSNSVVGSFSLDVSTQATWYWTCSNAANTSGVSCSASNSNVPVNGQCGSANGQQMSSAPSGSSLCIDPETPPTVYGGTTGPWTWVCVGTNGGSPSGTCKALPPGSQDGQCGSANGQTMSTQPTTGLCHDGQLPAVTFVSSDNVWIWTCPGTNGGIASPTCQAIYQAGTINGVCGTSNNLIMPDAPDWNLCSQGNATPSPVASIQASRGVGSNGNAWQWACQGSGGGTDATCAAYQCNSCSGTITVTKTAPHNGSSMSSNGCMINGTAQWIEVDQLSSSSTTATKTLSWSDDLGGFSTTLSSPVDNNACQPCYAIPQSVSGAQTIVNSASTSCPSTEGVGKSISSSSVTLH